MRVSELMTRNPVQVRPEQTLREVAALMKQNDCGCLPVEDPSNHRCVGVVTDRDIVTRAIAAGRGVDTQVRDVMTSEPSCCGPDDDVNRVERIMADEQVRRVPILDANGHTVGIVAQADLARAANGSSRGGVSQRELATVVEKVSEPSAQVRR